MPYAFTEHGAVMLASVLNSPRAVRMSVHVVRAFVSVAHLMSKHKELAAKIFALEGKVGKHDRQLQNLLDAIKLLITPNAVQARTIKGFGK